MPEYMDPLNPSPKTTGLISRVTRRMTELLLRQDTPGVTDPNAPTTATGVVNFAHALRNEQLWTVSYHRRQIYNDLRDMDQNDPIISTALDVIADCTTGYEDDEIDAFEWQMQVQNPKAYKILQDLKIRLALGTECWHLVRSYVQHGEEFREIVVDDDGVVRRFVHLPNYSVDPKYDDRGSKAPGWEQRLDPGNWKAPIEFKEWQIVAFRYGARRGWYGTGLMLPARRDWKRLMKMEDGMALARIIRAYDKRVHFVPGQPNWDEKRWQQAITTYKMNMIRQRVIDDSGNLHLRNWPEGPETDYFIPDDGSGKGKIELQSAENVQLQNVADVQHHQNRLLARIKVPRKYLNLGAGTTGALTDGGLSAEDRQFARTLRQVQAVLREGMMRLAQVTLALQGYDAMALGVNLQMPKISTEDMLLNSRIQMNDGQAARFFAEVLGGLPPEIVADRYMQLSPDEKGVFSKWMKDEEKRKEEEAKKAEALAKEAQKRPQLPVRRGLLPANNKRPVSGQADLDAPTIGDVAEVTTKLAMATQAVLEQHGVQFNVGYEERRLLARQILSEMEAFE